MNNPLEIPDLLEKILSHVSDPRGFLSSLQVNREWSQIGKRLVEAKKEEFLREREHVDKNGFIHTVKTFPNGVRHGQEVITDEEGNLVAERTWIKNVLHGLEKRYLEDELYKEIPWEHGKRHGIQKKYLNGKVEVITYWKNGVRTRRDKLDANGTVVVTDNFSSPLTFVRSHLNGNLQMIRDGVYIKNRKHGFYTEKGKQVLYLHGVRQHWYDPDLWSYILAVFLILLYIIYLCVRRRSIWPVCNTTGLMILSVASVLIIIPFFTAFYRGSRLLFTKSS